MECPHIWTSTTAQHDKRAVKHSRRSAVMLDSILEILPLTSEVQVVVRILPRHLSAKA
jgi:hypothetical protein